VNTFRYDPSSDRYAPAPPDSELERLGVAYFQTAYELFEGGRYLPSAATGQASGVGGQQ
jgi:hypothetical protein